MSDRLVYTSRAAAKVDSGLILDGFSLYHHTFVFNKKGEWAVVQQGMNTKIGRARRYHWLGSGVSNLLEEPHTGIASQGRVENVLDLTSKKSLANKEMTLEIIKHEKSLYRDLKIITRQDLPQSRRGSFDSPPAGGSFQDDASRQLKILDLPGIEFSHHPVEKEFLNPQLRKSVDNVVATKPTNFERLLMTPGVGARTIRALSLVSEVIYGAKPSYEDPARYSFAYGGKDGTPYPIDRDTYDKTLNVLEKAVVKSSLGGREKDETIRKINKMSLFS